MSFINRLKEYCYKHNFKLPKYTTKTIGSCHNIKWYSEIKVLNFEIVSTEHFDTKIEAEENVAKLACREIEL
jgi:hypothetical protein